MSEIILGKIIEGEAQRDAIHVAVAPVVAGHELGPGDHVGILDGGTAGGCPNPIGIVDPFLHKGVRPGQKFWLFLYPRTVTGLRHDWTHPAFELKHDVGAREWIKDFANDRGLSFAELMAAAKDWIEFAAQFERGGRGDSVPNEFWDHYYNLTGKRGSGNFFTDKCCP